MTTPRLNVYVGSGNATALEPLSNLAGREKQILSVGICSGDITIPKAITPEHSQEVPSSRLVLLVHGMRGSGFFNCGDSHN